MRELGERKHLERKISRDEPVLAVCKGLERSSGEAPRALGCSGAHRVEQVSWEAAPEDELAGLQHAFFGSVQSPGKILKIYLGQAFLSITISHVNQLQFPGRVRLGPHIGSCTLSSSFIAHPKFPLLTSITCC